MSAIMALDVDARQRISVAGSALDLREFDEAVDYISRRAMAKTHHQPPLAVASVNLDHIHHFGSGAAWKGVLDARTPNEIEWLQLIDGAPLAAQARRLTGHSWPRLAGSDLIGPTLDAAQRNGTTVGFLGGAPATHELLRVRMAESYPDLRLTGFWAPSREDISDPIRSREVANEIAEAKTDILVVGLGKPRQELWISRFGATTDARVLLAFGAVVDFLAGRVSRAPEWVVGRGLEWAWRLALEPRRLATRYLVEDPPAYVAVRRSRHLAPVAALTPDVPAIDVSPSADGRFLGADGHADVTVVLAPGPDRDSRIQAVSEAIHRECSSIRLRLLIMGKTDTGLAPTGTGPITIVGHRSDGSTLTPSLRFVGDSDTVLLLDAGILPTDGMVEGLLRRMTKQRAGVVVPRLVGRDAHTVPSHLPPRRSGLFASLSGRNTRRSVVAARPETYENAHRIEADTSGVMLIHREVVDTVGLPDDLTSRSALERYFDRLKAAGYEAWFEPDAVACREAVPAPYSRGVDLAL